MARSARWRVIRTALWLVLLAGSFAPAYALRLAAGAKELAPGEFDLYEAVRGDLALQIIQAPEPTRAAVTLQVTATVQRGGPGSTVQRLYLAGLSTQAGAAPDYVAVTWEPSAANWFGTVWSLQLHAAGGVGLPGGKQVASLELASVPPRAGHRYETLLSYTAATGDLAVSIVDVTEGKTLHAGTYRIAPHGGDLWPAAGSADKATAAATAGWTPPVEWDEFWVVPVALPVGAQWSVGSPTEAGLITVTRFAVDDVVGMELKEAGGQGGAGTFRLYVEAYDGTVLSLDASELVTTGALRLDAGALPLGRGLLHLDFAGPDGRVLLTGTHPLVVGHVRVDFTSLTADRANGVVRGTAWVSGAAAIGTAMLTIQADVEQAIWDAAKRSYQRLPYATWTVFDGPVDVTAGPAVGFAVPMPEEPGLWVVTVRAESAIGLGVEASGATERWFTTYPPATIAPGEPYVIAVLPDTQLYSWSHPEIFRRQTAWLAEQAAARNIAMVLHLGDVTEMNQRREWLLADQVMGLLDGVVPYALTVGNHDLIDGSYAVYRRSATLLHEYFPPERFANLAGTFAPGEAENSYHLAELGGVKYLFLMLEYAPRDEVLAWADEVLAAHPDRRVIVVTHTYLAGSGSARVSPYTSSDYPQKSPLANAPGETVNDGEQIWDKLIRKHPNIVMVWSGHIPTTAIRFRMSAGAAAQPIYELLADFQGEPLGGNGWLVLMEFTPDGWVTLRTYSPYLERYNTAVDAYGYTNHVTIELATGKVHKVDG